jgi:CHAT domain-containing protein
MPKDMDDLLYQHRVSDLWQRLAGCTWRDTQRLLERERDLLTDLRWWPTVLKLLAPPATSFSHPTIEGLWIPQVPGIPTRATITVADVGLLAAGVYEALSRLPPQRLGPSGAVNLLLAASDADAFSQQAARLASHMDDAFFEVLFTLAEEARSLGLESFAQQVEALRRLVVSVLTKETIAELASEAVRARTDSEAASRILRAARTAPRWLRSALEEMPGRAREELPAAPVARALQRACEALEEGQDEATILANLENWLPLRQFLARHRLLLKAPFPMRPGEDWLARYGAKARAFLLQLGQAQDAQTLALYRLALAENEAEAEQAIAGEPHLLSAAGEQQTRLQARSAQEQGQVTLASRLSAAAERIHAWLNELIRSERNAIVRLAEEVRSGELSLSEALAQVQQPETLRDISVLHVAALDEQVNRLYQNGDLYQAELLASLSYAAARLLDNRKLRADLAISLAEIKSELGRHAEALPLFEEAVKLAETLNEPFRLIRSVGPLGTVYEKLGRYDEARRYYERALSLARQAGLEGLEAAALGNLAGLHLLTGDLTSALRDSEGALAKARAAEDRYQIAQSLSTRALVLHRAARYDEALPLYKEALDALHRLGDVISEVRLRLHQGQALAETGQLAEALAEFEEAHQSARNIGHLPLQAKALSVIGTLHLRRGDLVQALHTLEDALAIENGLEPSERVTALLNLAHIQMNLNQLDFAERALNQAMSTAASIDNPLMNAQIALYRARYLAERKEWSESEAGARQVLTLAQQLHSSELELWALELLGRTVSFQGRLEEAAHWYVQALDRARQHRRAPEVASFLIHLGILQARLNQVADAQAALTEALDTAGELGLTYLQFYAHYNLGHLYASLNNLPQALEHYRAAIHLLERERAVLSQVETFEQRYAAERQDVYRLAAEIALRLNRPLEALEMLEQERARWLARQIAQREAIPPTVPEELRARYDRTFQAVQFLRSIVYGEPGWGMQAVEEAHRGLKLLEQAQTEEKFERMMAEAREREQQGYQQALADAEAELDQVTQEIRRHVPDFAAPLELPPLDWSRIADDPETAIVALFSGDQMACAVVLHPSGQRVVDLPGLQRAEVERLLYGLPQPLEQVYQEIEQQIAQSPEKRALAVMVKHYLTLRWIIEQAPSFQLGWQVAIRTLISEKTQAEVLARGREWMRQRSIPVEERETTLFDLDDARRLTMWQHLFDEMVAELKTRLWQPLLPLLRELGVSQVVLIPDADLHALPLAVGLADEPEPPAVAIALSLRLYAQSIRWLREREPRENSLMLIANPTEDLSATQVEAALLRDLFSAHGEAAFVLSGKQATMQNISRTSRVGNYWHFAGHAQYVWWNPAVSALWLAGKELLPFYWIPMWMDLRATRLAVLSACETAITPTREALPEFTGLFSAFLLAGAPAVLASLWPVEEISTALLIYRFYQYHLGDSRESLAPRPPAVALRDAQQWLRTLRGEEALNHPAIAEFKRLNPPRRMWKQILALEDKSQDLPFANPYFWSGFMLVGV